MGQHNICLRAGNHCAQPLLDRLGTTSTNRISFQIYNTMNEVEFFEERLKKTIDFVNFYNQSQSSKFQKLDFLYIPC